MRKQMASHTLPQEPLFGETTISLSVTAEEASDFFLEHGFFYEASKDIGQLIAALGRKALGPDGLKELRRVSSQQGSVSHPLPSQGVVSNCRQRLYKILEPFIRDRPSFSCILGEDLGVFFAHTIDDIPKNRAIIYMWGKNTQLELSYGSFKILLKGVQASNGLVQVPYVFLKKRNLEEISVNMLEGGV